MKWETIGIQYVIGTRPCRRGGNRSRATMTVKCNSIIFYCSLKHLQIVGYKSLNHWVMVYLTD